MLYSNYLFDLCKKWILPILLVGLLASCDPSDITNSNNSNKTNSPVATQQDTTDGGNDQDNEDSNNEDENTSYNSLLSCEAGSSGDLASKRGIRFTVAQNFSAVQVSFESVYNNKTYNIEAELRRSGGFTTTPIASDTAEFTTDGDLQNPPYKGVTFDFGEISVEDSTRFTLKFDSNETSLNGLYFEVHNDITPCDNVHVTEENDTSPVFTYGLEKVPGSFKVLAESSFEDTTPPEISYTIENKSLWPPNNKMKLAISDIAAEDNVSGQVEPSVSVESNESSPSQGRGNNRSNWELIDNGDGTYDLELRAQRNGNGTGREYTVTITATDEAGNTATETAEITVPHDQGKR